MNSNDEIHGADAQMELINKLSRRKLSREEVYIFPVVLCDNEVDRDGERFSISALDQLAKLYVGKTGIFDHSMHGKDQCARIFACEVERDSGKKTLANEDYCSLKAYAYMPRTEKNKDLITEIDSGIKKEVSVGCATSRRICSVCGAELSKAPCGHIRGRYYKKGAGKELCHTVLDGVTDAYEWSFVAVPAQPKAGVTKSFSTRFNGGEYVEALVNSAEEGAIYRDEVRASALRYCLIAQPEMTAKNVEKLLAGMDLEQLKNFRDTYRSAAAKKMPVAPQLAAQKDRRASKDTKFII